MRRAASPYVLLAFLAVAAFLYLDRGEVLNYLYITRVLWQILTGWPLAFS